MKHSHILISDICYIMNCIYVYYVLYDGFSHWAPSSPPIGVWDLFCMFPRMDRLTSWRPSIPLPGIVKGEEESDLLLYGFDVYKNDMYLMYYFDIRVA